MNVLVTGHSGYIGGVMVPTLQRAGHEIVGLDTGFFQECTLFDARDRESRGPRDVRSIARDLRDLRAGDLEGVDAVVHLAALSNDPLGALQPELTRAINHDGSRRLAELAKTAGVRRFLFASSCSMYGASDGDALLDEQAPFNPITTYAESKVRFERDLTELASSTFSPVCLRNATAYGVSPLLRLDIVLNNLVAWAYTTGKVRIMSDGTPWRPLVHVEDICRVFALMLEAPIDRIHNRAFNVGQSSENYQVRDLATIVERTVPDCTIEYAGASGPDARNYRVDFSRLATTFPDFRFSWNAERGAAQLYDAYREAGLTREALDGRRFIRLNQLTHLMSTGAVDQSLRWTKT